MKLYRKLSNLSKGNYYDSIHNCTIYAFDKALSTSNMEVIHISGKYNPIKAKTCWTKIFNEYIKDFGIPESYSRYLKLMVKACNLYSEAWNENKRHLIVNAKIKQRQANNEMLGVPENINKTAARVAKFMRMPIDVKVVTVSQFYSYLEIMKDGQ